MAKFILVVLFLAVTIPGVSSSQCPEDPYKEWVDEDTKCQQQNPGHRYHCLYDIDKDMAIPLCAPAVNCTPGTHTKIDAIGKTVTCTPCSSDMYQPEAKVSYSFTQPNCDRRKRECGKGEVQCGEATATHNYKCSCNFSQGMRPNDINKCDCFIKDIDNCLCIKANCDVGEVLAADFSCVPKYVPQSTKDPIVSTQEYTSGDLSTGAIVGIVLGVIVAVIVAVIVGICCYKKRKNKNSTTEYASVENGMSSESSNTYGKSSNPTKETNIDVPSPTKKNADEDEAKVRLLPTTEDSELYNRIKATFVDSVDPSSLLIRLSLSPSDEEKEGEYIHRNGREAGAFHLLQTVRRTHPDDWFDCIVKAMKDPNVGLQHIVEKMEGVREEMNGKHKTETLKCELGDCNKSPDDSGGCTDCNKSAIQDLADRTDITLDKSMKTSVQEDGATNDATERKIAY